MTDEERRQSDAKPQDVLTTVRKRIELVLHEIADTELIAMLRTAMSELDAVLARSGAEPVAWQYREPDGEWQICDAATDIYYRTSKYEMRPLYTAPPRPDASAGLIEPAEWSKLESAKKHLEDILQYPLGGVYIRTGIQAALVRLKEVLRARAADRSGKP